MITIRGLGYAAAALSLLMATGCADLQALEAQLNQNLERAAQNHPLGPLGPGFDMYLADEQIRAMRGR